MKARRKAAAGHLFKRGTVYYLRWRVGGKQECVRLLDAKNEPITTLPEAEAARLARLAYLGHQEKADQDAALLAHRDTAATVAHRLDMEQRAVKMADGWKVFAGLNRKREPSAQTMAQYAAYWRTFKEWMTKRHSDALLVMDVTADHAGQYAASLARAGTTPRTYNARISALRMVTAALRAHDGETGPNPWTAVELKTDAPARRDVVSEEQFRHLYKAAPLDLKPLLLLAFYTGQRTGDLAMCQWPELDLTAGVWRMKQRKTGTTLVLPLPGPLLRELSKAPEERRRGFLMPEVAEQYRTNRRWLVERVMDVFREVLGDDALYHEGAGKLRRPRYSLHSLRHTYNTTLLEANTGTHTVQALTGHTTDAMTAHYAHIGLPALRAAVAALPDVCGKASPKASPKVVAMRQAAHDIINTADAKTLRRIMTAAKGA